MLGRAEKLQSELGLLSDDGLRFGLRFQPLFENALNAVDIQQVELESPSASRLQTNRAVALGQTQQFLRLAQTAPGELAAQKLFGEIASGSSQLPGPLAVVVGPAPGLGNPVIGIIGVIGRAASGRLARMRLDQLAARIDAHPGAISADIHRAADPACGNRVQRLSKRT